MKRMIALRIEQKANHWVLTSTGDQPLRPFELAQRIAFHDFPSSLGLQLEMSGDSLLLTTEQLLRLLDESRLHFIAFEGADEQSKQYVTAIRQATKWLRTNDWHTLTLDEEERFSFEHDDPLVAELLTMFINERFRSVPAEQLPRVMQFMNEHAVLEQPNALPIRLALRLTEPEENETDWLAEIVIITEKNAHWTPARSKVNAPIEKALPKKWKPYAEELATLQNQLLSLCPTFSVDQSEHFFYASLNERQVQQLLKDDLTLLRAFDFEIILPSWLKQLTETKVTARAEAMTSYKKTASFDDIVEFDWQFAIGDQQIDRATFEQLLEEQRQFIRIADEWFQIDDVALQKLKQLIEEAESKKWTVRELLLEKQADDESDSKALFQDDGDSPVLAFTLNKQLRQFAQTFREKKEIPVVPLPDTLQATLRPYQREGFDWLVFMRQYEFGACLADDMGLGKTVQLIAYLLHVKEQNIAQSPALIICPTSVLGNWQKELERFAPSLNVHVHYGQSRVGEQFSEWMNETDADVILTTYGTATQDSE
ncbi:MAG TPA: DEAD/DEAH box helicase, partial [Savagea sp.]